MKLTNTLSGHKEVFKPLDANNVKMYVCGPTVYDRAHLGNARSAVVYDVLFRVLSAYFPKVIYVRNITDVDDKIIEKSIATRQPIEQITSEMTAFYHQDLAALNCLPPTHEPRATKHLPQMVSMIEKLIAGGFAYESAGHVLFAPAKFEKYGALSKRSHDEMMAGARIEVAEFKKDPADFVLWKPYKNGEEPASFPSPWGLGRPGWHIECSAMSHEYLGPDFDIHGGGADLTFPHHENEIAQSMCAHEHSTYAQFWVHNGFLTVEGEKMSKSLGNFYTVDEVLKQGVEGGVLRYLYLTTHYRKPFDYSAKAVHDAKKAIAKFRAFVGEEVIVDYKPSELPIFKFLLDDLNTSMALAYMHDLASEPDKNDAKKIELAQSVDFLGLNLSAQSIPESIMFLAERRHLARQNKDWVGSDKLRKELLEHGYAVEDSTNGKYKVVKV